MSEILKIHSNPVAYGLLKHAEPFGATLMGWNVGESLSGRAYPEVEPKLGWYSVALEREVSSANEITSFTFKAVNLIEELDRVWAYCWGTPLHGSGFGIFLVPVTLPRLWTTNADGIRKKLQKAQGGLIATVTSHDLGWRYGFDLPLRRAMQLRQLYMSAPDVLRTLIDLHYEAHITGTSHGAELLFSKALEIVRKLLQGKSDDEREKQLPPEVRDNLSHSLHWLLGISNSRRSTRHAVKKGRVLVLHEPLGRDAGDFLKDADMVINAVICQQFGVEPILALRRAPPQATDTNTLHI